MLLFSSLHKPDLRSPRLLEKSRAPGHDVVNRQTITPWLGMARRYGKTWSPFAPGTTLALDIIYCIPLDGHIPPPDTALYPAGNPEGPKTDALTRPSFHAWARWEKRPLREP
jgi:hypothetical protein